MICGLIWLTGTYPLALAWPANRQTTLRHALAWTYAAWASWGLALVLGNLRPGNGAALAGYVAVCLAGCAAVAVLGARRPGVTVWNFVVLAQLGVLLLPIAEGLGELRLDPLRLTFLGATLATGVLNYLPTRLAAATVALGIGCGVEVWLLHNVGQEMPDRERVATISRCLLAASPWFALIALHAARAPASQFDGLWLGFRDRFGLVWGQRVREQFNRAAYHAGWPVVLRWRGLRVVPEAVTIHESQRAEMIAVLQSLLKRFGPEEPPEAPTLAR